jgi:hypothetical protein
MIVVGFGVVLVVLPIMLMVVRMAEASDVAAGEARFVAMWVARHGHEPNIDQRSDIDVEVSDGEVRVKASLDVDLIAVGGSRVSRTVVARFEMPISPYRSDR